MTHKTILTVVGANCTQSHLEPVIEVARSLEARLAVAVVGIAPSAHVYASAIPYGGMSVADDFGLSLRETVAELAEKTNEVEGILQAAGIAGDVTTVYSELAVLDAEIAKLAMVCDFAILPQTNALEDTLYSRALSGILFRSPIGVVVANDGAKIIPKPKRIFVAWNTSLQSARALHQALPKLIEADEVIVGLFDPVMNKHSDGEDPGTEVAAWLSHHGCNVTLQQRPTGGRGVGKSIIESANETGAELVVMGAYGHSKLQQWMFGGTTSVMLKEADIPVFFAH